MLVFCSSLLVIALWHALYMPYVFWYAFFLGAINIIFNCPSKSNGFLREGAGNAVIFLMLP